MGKSKEIGLIKVEDWILEDIRRIRKIPQPSRSPDEHSYLKLLSEYSNKVQEFNIMLRRLKK